MQANLTAKEKEQAEAKAFLDFVDRVSTALYGRVYEDLLGAQERSDVLNVVERCHKETVN